MEITPEQIRRANDEWSEELEQIAGMLTEAGTDLFGMYPFDGDFARGLSPKESLIEAIWWLHEDWRLKLEL